MFVDASRITRGTKTYTRHLLRDSYRDDGKVKHRTIANISSCSDEEIEAIRLALRHKGQLAKLGNKETAVSFQQGASFGAVYVVHEMASRLGITKVLGDDQNGKLALWQVIARVIGQGSRLSAVRLAKAHAASELIGFEAFNEDHLYANLDWLSENQPYFEKLLFKNNGSEDGLFLYDVTSSYLEGEKNELGAFGYNRDKKRGKRQIVIGLLCNRVGCPLAIEVFLGNTQDTKTFASQVKKISANFGGGDVTFVGDRGMINKAQINDLLKENFHYITAISKPQIENLINQGLIQLNLFDTSLAEITDNDGLRYILRRNPIRAEEIVKTRSDKYDHLRKAVDRANDYLADHPRASPQIQLRNLQAQADKLNISIWAIVSLSENNRRSITLTMDTDRLAEISELDGCYVLKTDLHKIPKEAIHSRYKDLKLVGWAFRESKSRHLEMRPIHVRLESRTRGHAFVVMLAYSITKALTELWQDMEVTVQEGLEQLASLCLTEVHISGQPDYWTIPTPRKKIQQLLTAANIKLPRQITPTMIKMSTNTKLVKKRN